MKNDTVTRKILILDREYCISAPQSEQDNVQDAARYLDHMLRDIKKSGKIVGMERMTMLAALNVTAELLQLRHLHANQTQALDAQSAQWLQDLEGALSKSSSVPHTRDCT